MVVTVSLDDITDTLLPKSRYFFTKCHVLAAISDHTISHMIFNDHMISWYLTARRTLNEVLFLFICSWLSLHQNQTDLFVEAMCKLSAILKRYGNWLRWKCTTNRGSETRWLCLSKLNNICYPFIFDLYVCTHVLQYIFQLHVKLSWRCNFGINIIDLTSTWHPLNSHLNSHY